jgi:hypothetical protein
MKRFALALPAIVVGLVVSSCAVGVRQPATEVAPNSAVLNGKVLSSTGGPGSWYIEYGQTAAHTEKTPTRTIDFVTSEIEPVSEPVDGLEPSTTYHFAVCAEDSENPGDPFCSPDQTFRTTTDATSDSVRVTGNTRTWHNIDIEVSSGPSGENPTGHGTLDISYGGGNFDHWVLGAITCFSINGNTASIAGVLAASDPGFPGFAITVVDQGPADSGLDSFTANGAGEAGPTECPANTFRDSLIDGNAVVVDAPAPTS